MFLVASIISRRTVVVTTTTAFTVRSPTFRTYAARPCSSRAAVVVRTTAPSPHDADADDDDVRYDRVTVAEALRESTASFVRHGVSEPSASACNLLAVSLDLPWEDGFRTLAALEEGSGGGAIAERALTSEEADRFRAYCRRRRTHEPLQYLVGRWDFYDFTLHCRAPILCPRPETEELVDLCLAELDRLGSSTSSSTTPLRILDVGCGTGAVGLALARHRPGVHVTALDSDARAVALSQENASSLLPHNNNDDGTYAVVRCAAADYVATTPFDVVVSNPPYIPRRDMAGLAPDVRDFESDGALCGGEDGLDVVRDIVQKLPEWTTPGGGGGGVCWLEVDTSHPALLQAWLSNDNNDTGVEFVETRRDLSGRERFVKLRVT